MRETQPAEPVRVIYAKLTSTGDYDVVAKTANIELAAARSLAEVLLPGNIPHDTSLTEELAYLRHPDGGHLVIRYTTYNWKDANRGDAFMTDIVWLNDADFARVRNNAFAVVQRTSDVYDVLTTLPPVRIDARATAADFDRLAELTSTGETLVPLAAGILAVQPPVLAIEREPARERLELFTLTLPPTLRPLLTWQTRAFRVPAYPPHVTIADALHANLQGGPWSARLPDVKLSVPLDLARTLVQAAGRPETLRGAHDVYDRMGPASRNLGAEVARLVDLVEFSEALDGGDFQSAFRLATTGGEAETSAKLAVVLARATPADIEAAVLHAIGQGSAGEAQALRLLDIAAQNDAGGAVSLHRAAARQAISGGRLPGVPLAVQLLKTLGAAGDADAVVLLVGLDRRIATSVAGVTLPSNPVCDWLRAVPATRGVADTHTLLAATAAVAPQLKEPAASARLATICREVVESAVDRAALNATNVAGMNVLRTAADDLVRRAPQLDGAIPLLFTRTQLDSLKPAAADTAIAGLTQERSAESRALLAGALLVSAARDAGSQGERLIAVARAALADVPAALRENVRRVVEETGVNTEDLLAVEGGREVLPLLGRNAEQATSTRDLLQAVRDLGTDDDAIPRLAAAVLTARTAQLSITPTHQTFIPLRTALGESACKRHATGREAAILEITLDLLATITDAQAFADLERAALGTGGMTVRLRRLDRAVALCRAAEDEVLYEKLAVAIESEDTAISSSARARLRDALGTGGIQRRLIQMITGVVERGA